MGYVTSSLTQPRLVLGPEVPPPRPTAQAINDAPKIANGGALLTADGAIVPLAYGRVPVQGRVIAQAIYSGDLYVAYGWGIGPMFGIEALFLNSEAVPAGVEVRHYLGTPTQGVDPWLAAAIAGYADTCVITDRGQSVALAYTVVKIPTSAVSGVPLAHAILNAKLVNDPEAGSNSDPYFLYNSIDVDFTSGGTDQSSNTHTITLEGGASITSGGLQLSGSGGDYATVADDATLELGSAQGTLWEVAATSTTIAAGVATLYAHTNSASTRSIQIDRDEDELLLYLSSDGTIWAIANGVNIGTITTAEFKTTGERVRGHIVVYLDG